MIQEERREAGGQLRATSRILAANRSTWKENVKVLRALWHGEIQRYGDGELPCSFGTSLRT